MFKCSASRRRGPPFSSMWRGKSSGNLSQYFAWYPDRCGQFLGDMLAGHNVFIQDVPKQFDAAHAKHFALVESVSVVPVFALSIVHYLSSYCSFASRMDWVEKLLSECTGKGKSIRFWVDQLRTPQSRGGPSSVGSGGFELLAWRGGLLFVQVATFPFWLLLCSASPAVAHSALCRVNHILASKYACVMKSGPPFVQMQGRATEEYELFHKSLSRSPTDVAVAFIVLFLLWFLA